MKELWAQLLLVVAIALVISAVSRQVVDQRQTAFATQTQDNGLGRPNGDSRGSQTLGPGPGISVSSNAMIRDEKRVGDRGKESGPGRVREGREVNDPHANFQIVGERITCNLKDHGLSVTVLENLTLERVHQYLSRGNSSTTWEVEGKITEYEGENYLILRRAIINSLESDE